MKRGWVPPPLAPFYRGAVVPGDSKAAFGGPGAW